MYQDWLFGLCKRLILSIIRLETINLAKGDRL